MWEEMLLGLGLKKASVIGGFFGSLISLKFIAQLNLWQGAATLFSGWMLAAWTTPVVIAGLTLSDKHEGGVGFLIGVMGMAVISNIFKAMPDWIAAAKVKAFGNDGKANNNEGGPK